MMKLKIIAALMLLSSTSCHAFTSTNSFQTTSDRELAAFEVRDLELNKMLGVHSDYDYDLDKKYIEGIDNNNDGVRDALVKIARSLIYYDRKITKDDYEELLSLLIEIQPKKDPIKDSKSVNQLKCRYYSLHPSIQKEASFEEIRARVLNSASRRSAFGIEALDPKADPNTCEALEIEKLQQN
ncbi:hypothetical protein [Photobacterium galatheae]|uniref:hypothetical protein n=1 Tax=Photobacterium galatheae TaxID=1654360 RepID=UPI00068E853D|nr:hypothetical protein [Photobacterium galatheae]MCM0148316.1 hypothetical protein [Photobacterium galatheae]